MHPFLYPAAEALTTTSLPDPICHYTDQRGFLGILSSRSIWAADLRYLNDSEEYQVGFRKVLQRMETLTADNVALKAMIARSLDPITLDNAVGVGVASFSAIADDLSQWRGYGSGSGGIAIEFDPALLALHILMSGSSLGQCIYDEDEHDRVVAALCDAVVADAKLALTDDAQVPDFMRRTTLSVQLTCALLKDSAFAAEREYRMVVWFSLPPSLTQHVRAGRSTLVPYFSVPLDFEYGQPSVQRSGRLPIRTVRVGPTAHPRLAARAAQLALQLENQPGSVSVSRVPFRNW